MSFDTELRIHEIPMLLFLIQEARIFKSGPLGRENDPSMKPTLFSQTRHWLPHYAMMHTYHW